MVINDTGALEFTTDVVKLEEDEVTEDILETNWLDVSLLEINEMESDDEMEVLVMEDSVRLVSSKLESKDEIWELKKLEFSGLEMMDNDDAFEGKGISQADNKVDIKINDFRYGFFIYASYQ